MLKMITGVLVVLVVAVTVSRAEAQTVTRAEVARVRYELGKVEQKLKDSGGTPIELSKTDLAAFEAVKALAEREADNPDVVQLVEDAKGFYNRAKGVRFVITPEMLAYRERQSQLESQIGETANRAWEEVQTSAQVESQIIQSPFPVRFPPDIDAEEVEKKFVILSEIDWEKALFIQTGVNWIPAGNESQGFYFIDGSSREYNQLYEAMQRYRNQVKSQIGARLTYLGTIDSPIMLAPDGKAEKAGTPQMGWLVRLKAIHVPNTVTVMLDASHDNGAVFAGENNLSELRRFSVDSVPENVEPLQLIKIYVDAIKEKNWELHLECLDPSLRSHEAQLQGLRYTWELQQKGLENFHCHAEPVEMTPINVTKGFVDDGLESFFGDGVAREPASEKEERTVVTVQLFDDRGIQTVRPRYLTLIRRNEGRWYIWSGMTLTF